jgi:hypothetical protein
MDLALVFLAAIFELDGCSRHERKLLFGVNHCAPETLHAFVVLRQILAPFACDVLERNAKQQMVDVVAAQVRVAIRRQHFENPVVQFQNRNVECAAAQVVHRHDAVFALIEPVGQRRRSRLIDQSQDFQARNASGILGGLPLRIVKVCRHRDDGLVHGDPEVFLGILLQLPQNHRRNLGRCVGAIAELELNHRIAAGGHTKRKELQLFLDIRQPAAHQPFHGINCAFRLRHQQLARWIADHYFAARPNRNHARHQFVAIGAWDNSRPGEVHESHQAVGGPEVDADDMAGAAEVDVHGLVNGDWRLGIGVQGTLHFRYKILHVLTAVQDIPDLDQDIAGMRSVVLLKK